MTDQKRRFDECPRCGSTNLDCQQACTPDGLSAPGWDIWCYNCRHYGTVELEPHINPDSFAYAEYPNEDTTS